MLIPIGVPSIQSSAVGAIDELAAGLFELASTSLMSQESEPIVTLASTTS